VPKPRIARHPLPSLESISGRLHLVFPEDTVNRNYCIRKTAVRTVAAALYIDAIEGTGTYLAPRHVYRMSDERYTVWTSRADRLEFARTNRVVGARWYADNTREPVRDETIREGLERNGAIIQRPGVPTNASTPRYALQSEFAALFDPKLNKTALRHAVMRWQGSFLSPASLARVRALARAKAGSKNAVTVTLPNGAVHLMGAGEASAITKAVVEEFAEGFLDHPAVIWLSEPARKVLEKDDRLARDIGINIDVHRTLPDCILLDAGHKPLLVFVEVVATDGAITEARRAELLALAPKFSEDEVAFVTAFESRSASAFKRNVPVLAWGSFAWFVAEPGKLLDLRDGTEAKLKLSDLLRPTRGR
jgi:hypothetical protein